MNKREMICIRCPMGCHLSVTQDENGCTVTGNTCPRGREYGVQEMTCPTRVVTSSVRVENGRRPVCSVKTATAVPKADIPAAFYRHYPAYALGQLNVSELARVCGLSRPTVYKYLRLIE